MKKVCIVNEDIKANTIAIEEIINGMSYIRKATNEEDEEIVRGLIEDYNKSIEGSKVDIDKIFKK